MKDKKSNLAVLLAYLGQCHLLQSHLWPNTDSPAGREKQRLTAQHSAGCCSGRERCMFGTRWTRAAVLRGGGTRLCAMLQSSTVLPSARAPGRWLFFPAEGFKCKEAVLKHEPGLGVSALPQSWCWHSLVCWHGPWCVPFPPECSYPALLRRKGQGGVELFASGPPLP